MDKISTSKSAFENTMQTIAKLFHHQIAFVNDRIKASIEKDFTFITLYKFELIYQVREYFIYLGYKVTELSQEKYIISWNGKEMN